MKNLIIVLIILFICEFTMAQEEVKYRTFSQLSLSGKPNKLKVYGSKWCYQLINTNRSNIEVNGVKLFFSAKVESITDMTPFVNVDGIGSKTIVLSGTKIDSGMVVNICGTGLKNQMTLVKYVWLINGSKIGNAQKAPSPILYQQLIPMPNFAWARFLIYQKVYTSNGGLLIGIERFDSVDSYGWLYYMNGAVTREAFPHTGNPRGFDTWGKQEHPQQPFIGPKRNFKVWKHDNHLLGEVHALKLAVTANEIGLTEPDTPHTALGDLIFNDLTDPNNILNGKTIRQILLHADSALTMWKYYPRDYHKWLDSIISMINNAFIGDMDTVSTNPLKIKGAVALSSIPFLHPNMNVRRYYFIAPEKPFDSIIEREVWTQNYPNPFNPTTTIEFKIKEEAVVSLKVYNLLGIEVANLLDNKRLDADTYSFEFDGSKLPSGIYFYRITGRHENSFEIIKKILLIK